MDDTLIIAEKPAVARDIARVVGAGANGAGFLRGGGYTVTWAIGHLVTLPEPHEISPEWKVWRTSALPMLPESWPLKVVEKTKDQFGVVKRLLKECREVICATDAGREGELIFRYIYEAAKCRKPVRRLWISSLTPDAIRAGLARMKSASAYDALANAARGRSRADWLVGMNLSRAYALTFGDRYFVGRVQTPTLALVVKRDREILDFKPEDYLEIEAIFAAGPESYPGSYLGEDAASDRRSAGPGAPKPQRFPPDGAEAEAVVARVRRARAWVQALESKTVRQPPPLLYDLTELQRHANRVFGFSAARTLELAQALYERHKLISYPRTDSNHLSQSEARTLKDVVAAISGPYRERLRPGTGETPLGSRYVDDTKVTDHHAILPTAVRPNLAALGLDERKIYDLVCRRLLALWQGDYVTAVTVAHTAARAGDGPTDVFRTQGTVVVEPGWKALDLGQGRTEGQTSGPLLPRALKPDLPVTVADVKTAKKTTRPPPFLTDASLLAAMETAGKVLEDRELAAAMRESGLGTPATRAGIIETLLARGYLVREGKCLKATPLGMRLIDTVHPTVKSPELTARWEKELARIQRGEESLGAFLTALEEEIKARVAEVLSVSPAPGAWTPTAPEKPAGRETPSSRGRASAVSARASVPPSSPRRPLTDRSLDALLQKTFGFSSFRPYQEEVCRAVVEGKDALLVMPTGAGKSLCYQLPGLARGGTTLVVSPLVALIDDQVEKLKQLGLAAERIHSGRKREESRAVCARYLSGELDFLFVAPERLAVPGFPEMLRRRPLSLIAIDEAHCISHWGHDFRPDYRLLGDRLDDFRPTPVIALTATATPLVQEDIARQLNLKGGLRSIHGFRRTNIAIQLAELDPGERPEAIIRLLQDKERLPAIVYAPTRKVAEKLSDDLRAHFRVEAYHAGMSASARDRTQERYLRGELDVMVATIAFGMGIDKPNVRTVVHAALPGSVEGYYQEIGRAGRDGKMSRAVLFHSFVDRKTHEFFFEKSYPPAAALAKIFRELEGDPIPKAALRGRVRSLDDETFERALEKLWIHKGALIDPDENVSGGSSDWERPYAEQREHRLRQIQQTIAFTETRKCRMLHLVEHFGDTNDSGEPCGVCDVCLPSGALAHVPHHDATEAEQKLAASIMARLSGRRGYPAGRLHQDLEGQGEEIPRKQFESVLAALVREGWVESIQESFRKGGQTISFRKLSITELGNEAGGDDLPRLQIKGDGGEGRSRRKGKGRKRAPAKKVSTADVPPALFEALREWRLMEARKKRVPAFRILTDAVLQGICAARPVNETELLDVKGLGPALVARYGSAVLEVIQNHGQGHAG